MSKLKKEVSMQIRDSILIIEDDNSILNLMKVVLKANNYDVYIARTGTEALSIISSQCPNLLILDLGLPDMDGTDIIRKVRSWSTMPILIVSARDHENDKVQAFDLGADDYITKPFGTSEFLARIRAALRHSHTISENSLEQSQQFQAGKLHIDFNKHKVSVNGEDVHLTQNEYRILSMLAKYSGRVITYDAIMKEIWGPNMKSDNKILRVNMANIRRKIEHNPAEPEYIFTEAGVGYRLLEAD